MRLRRNLLWLSHSVLLPLISFAIVCGLWQLYAWHKQVATIPGLRDIVSSMPRTLRASVLEPTGREYPWYSRNVWATLERVFYGLVFGSIVGIVLGSIIATFKSLRLILTPAVEFFRSIPATALVPVFITIFPEGAGARLALSVYITTWLVTFNTYRSLGNVGKQREIYLKSHLPTARIPSYRIRSLAEAVAMVRQSVTWFSVTSRNLWKKWAILYFWELLPDLATSIRVALSLSLLVTVAAEMWIGSDSGLGKIVFDYDFKGDYAGVMSSVLLIGVIGLGFNQIAEKLEKRAGRWRI